MKAPAPPRLLVSGLAAAAGVVLAHALDYLVLYPRSGSRQAYLHATGHGYWPLAMAGASVAAALVVLVVGGSAVLRAARGAIGARGRAWVNVSSLVAWQMGAFVVMEVGERSTAGLAPTALLDSPEFWLGLLLQLPVALVLVALLRGVERTAEAIGGRWRRPSLPSRGPVRAAASVSARPRACAASPARPRGPPAVGFS